MHDLRADGDSQAFRDGVVRRNDIVGEHACAGLVMRGLQILVEADQLDLAGHPSLNNLRADTTAAHEKSLVDQLLDGTPHCEAGQAEPLPNGDLVLQPCTGPDVTAPDRPFQSAGAIQIEEEFVGPHGLICGHGVPLVGARAVARTRATLLSRQNYAKGRFVAPASCRTRKRHRLPERRRGVREHQRRIVRRVQARHVVARDRRRP